MKKNIGLWIDHRQAVLVTTSDSGEELQRIESNVEKHVRSASGSRSKTPEGPQKPAADNAIDRKFAQHLAIYYKQVIECLRDAESILILGPGEAKIELRKQIRDKSLLARISAVETVDKLTEPQLKAKVRDHFTLKTSNR